MSKYEIKNPDRLSRASAIDGNVMIEMELWKEHKSKEYRTITKIRASLEAWLCDLIVLGMADGKRIKCNFNGECINSIEVLTQKEA